MTLWSAYKERDFYGQELAAGLKATTTTALAEPVEPANGEDENEIGETPAVETRIVSSLEEYIKIKRGETTEDESAEDAAAAIADIKSKVSYNCGPSSLEKVKDLLKFSRGVVVD